MTCAVLPMGSPEFRDHINAFGNDLNFPDQLTSKDSNGKQKLIVWKCCFIIANFSQRCARLGGGNTKILSLAYNWIIFCAFRLLG